MSPLRRLLVRIIFVSLCVEFSPTMTATIATGSEASGDGDSPVTAANILERTTTEVQPDSPDTTSYVFDLDETTAFEPHTRADVENSTKVGVFGDLAGATIPGNESVDIIPIVGAVCGVAGILIGITISAVVWVYVTKKRMRKRVTSISKNPEEKTFERLDFNLTLPRQQTSNGSPGSVNNSLPDSGYLHFDEPTPYVDDVSPDEHPQNSAVIHREPHNSEAAMGADDELRYEECMDDVVFGYPESSTARLPRLGRGRYGVLPRSKYQSDSSFGALIHKDLSDQSTTSKRSSSTAGIERRSSTCTCRTDLPDSDGSNCSTCGGSVSVTSSLAREKPGVVLAGYRDHVHDFTSFIPVEETTFTEVPSSHFQDSASCDNIISSQHNELSSLSSADSFIHEHENWDDQATNHDREAGKSTVDDPLKYFDLELPPSTFNSPQKPMRKYRKDEAEYAVNDSDYIEGQVSHDDNTITNANSESTINL